MAHSRYLLEVARSLRAEQGLTVDELARRLALPRSTVYHWVRDLPLRRESAAGATTTSVTRAMRDAAYAEALSSYDELVAEPTFRDFVCVWIASGGEDRRARALALSGADPAVMRLVKRWVWRLSARSPLLAVRCLPERSAGDVRRSWADAVGAEPRAIRVHDMSSGAPSCGVAERGLHGVLTVAVEDALLAARMRAWACRTRESWR